MTCNYLNLVKSIASMARCFFIATLKALMLISLLWAGGSTARAEYISRKVKTMSDMQTMCLYK